MREDSVGFQCVECVAEGNRSVREARTVFGGRIIAKPYVTWALLGLIGAVFAAQVVSSGGLVRLGTTADPLVYEFGMWGGAVLAWHQWYRLLTGVFLHGGLMHLAFNGFALYVLGPQLERWLGHLRYAALWGVSALGGSVLGLLVQPTVMSVGASGAIFGLFGAVFVFGKRLRLDTRFILGLLVANLLITFLVPGIPGAAGRRDSGGTDRVAGVRRGPPAGVRLCDGVACYAGCAAGKSVWWRWNQPVDNSVDNLVNKLWIKLTISLLSWENSATYVLWTINASVWRRSAP